MNRLITVSSLFLFLCCNTFAQKEFEGNNLFLYLHQDIGSDSMQKLREHYDLSYPPSGGRLWHPEKGIEVNYDDNHIVEDITLYYGDTARRIFQTFASELPMGLKWLMTKEEVKNLIGAGANFLYNYDINQDLNLNFDNVNGKDRLAVITVSYHDWTPKTDLEKLILDPTKFTYLKKTATSTSNSSNFDKALFSRLFADMIDKFANDKEKQLMGNFINDDGVFKHYKVKDPLPGITSQEIQDFASDISFKAEIVKVNSSSDQIPEQILQEYDKWLSIVKQSLPVLQLPWTTNQSDLFLKALYFKNKTGIDPKSFLSFDKYPTVRFHIERDKTKGYYVLALNIN